MRQIFDGAIRKTGGIASLSGSQNNVGNRFFVSIQPERISGDGHSEIGAGYFCRFRLYTVYNEITENLREESAIEYGGAQYIVSHIETVCFGGKPMYRRGSIVMAEEAKANGEFDGA